MKVLVLNCGSSSIKFKLIEMPANKVLESGGIEKLALPDCQTKYKKGRRQQSVSEEADIQSSGG